MVKGAHLICLDQGAKSIRATQHGKTKSTLISKCLETFLLLISKVTNCGQITYSAPLISLLRSVL